jgi:hypothetical protein
MGQAVGPARFIETDRITRKHESLIVQIDSAAEPSVVRRGAEHQKASVLSEVSVARCRPQLTLALRPFHREAGEDGGGGQCHD